MKLQFIEAGEIVTTHGVRGEVKVLPWLDSAEDLCDFDRCRIGGKEYTIEKCRVQKSCDLVKLSGIDTMEAAQALRGKVKQYAVTNGTRIAQERKLKGSGLAELLDGVFISEILGVEKPGIGFFQQVWEKIGTYAPDEVMIVGDSLTSDIQGGNNAGILCCWFNPKGAPAPENLRIDYNIQTLSQILDLI